MPLAGYRAELCLGLPFVDLNMLLNKCRSYKVMDILCIFHVHIAGAAVGVKRIK